MGSRELCHDRHTVTLLTDHAVFLPKQTREILVEKVIVLVLDGIIRKTCKELNIEIIESLKNITNKFRNYSPTQPDGMNGSSKRILNRIEYMAPILPYCRYIPTNTTEHISPYSGSESTRYLLSQFHPNFE